MQKIVVALTLFAGAMLAADRQVTYQGDLSPLNIMPSFDHGYVIVWDRNSDGDNIYAKEGGKLVYLDNVSGKWQQSSLPRPGSLAGADENGLVFDLPDHCTFEWVAAGR